jgi:glutamyl-tRNA reductase
MGLREADVGRGPRAGGADSRLHVLVVGANHITSPIQVREALFRRATYERMNRAAGPRPPWEDLVLLRTCNRIEAYAMSGSVQRAHRAICKAFRLESDSPSLYALEDVAAVDHLLRVATGLESIAQGEGQVLTQVRNASLGGTQPRRAAGRLASLFAQAARSAQRIRAVAGWDPKDASASWAAVRFIVTAVPLEKPTVVLLGTGKMARLAAAALQGRAGLTFLGRNPSKARGAGDSFAGRSRGLRDLPESLVRADVIVAATSSEKPIIVPQAVRRALRERSGRRLWLLDLGFPRNIDPRCALLEGVALLDIDGLAPWGWRQMAPEVRARVESRIREETSRLLRLLIPPPEGEVAEFRKAVEAIRQDEVEEALARLPGLSERDQHIIDKLATRLVNRMLHAPTEWLRTLPPDRSARTVAEFVHRLQSSGGR